MAEQKTDPREVRKIRTAIALDGQKQAERRFGSSPEMQQVQRELQQGQARAVNRHRTARVEGAQATTTKENTTMNEKQQTNKQGRQKPAPTAAQQRIAQRQQAQARQNARLRDRGANRPQGMGM
ncbi:hypothetical protein ACWGJP_10585 [Microbacterium sp. NPDC055903]